MQPPNYFQGEYDRKGLTTSNGGEVKCRGGGRCARRFSNFGKLFQLHKGREPSSLEPLVRKVACQWPRDVFSSGKAGGQ